MTGSALAIVALTTSLSCATILEDLDKKIASDYPMNQLGDWQLSLCQTYAKKFTDFSFDEIAETKKGYASVDLNLPGVFTVGPITSGRVQLNWQAEESDTKVTKWLKVNATQETWVFANPISPENIIKQEDIQRVVVNVAPLMGKKNIGTESPVGKTAIRQIRRGQIFTEDLVSLPPLVKRNDQVTIVVNAGLLTISSPGIALETGWNMGDKVNVKVENSDGPIKAKITGKNNVFVEI